MRFPLLRRTEEQAMSNPQSLIDKIKALPAERVDEVEDFVDFIATRTQDRALTRDASSASVSAFAKIWSNPEDDAYDAL